MFCFAFFAQPVGYLTPAKDVFVKKIKRHHVEIRYKRDGLQHAYWINQQQFVSVSIHQIGPAPDYRALKLEKTRFMPDLPENATLLRIRTTNELQDLILLFEDYQQARSFAEKIVQEIEV
jgi:hypothetical protein